MQIFGSGSAVAALGVEPVEDYGVADEEGDEEDGAGCWVGD